MFSSRPGSFGTLFPGNAVPEPADGVLEASLAAASHRWQRPPVPVIARSKNPASRVRVTTSEVMVMLETMRGEFRGFGEALQGLREGVGARFNHVDARFDRVEEDLGTLKHDVGVLNHDVGTLKHDMILVTDAVLENIREIKRLSTLVDKKVDRDEVEARIEAAIDRRG